MKSRYEIHSEKKDSGQVRRESGGLAGMTKCSGLMSFSIENKFLVESDADGNSQNQPHSSPALGYFSFQSSLLAFIS